jgi:peptidylprolyl isomerase
MRRCLAGAAALLLALLAACGTEDGPAETGEHDLSTKPEIDVPAGDPPGGLTTTDLVVGDGDEAGPGATVTTHYVGVSWSTGAQFDASWDRGEPITFSLGQVIPGWQEGIPGMRVGGRRQLVIPPEMAYGDQPPPGSGIAPGETLVFVVDLVSVE